MFGLASKWIGLTIEHSGIRYIKLKNNKTGEIERKGYLPLRPGMIVENQIADVESFRSELSAWIKQENLKGHSVSLSIPPSQMIIRKLSIPSTNPKQVEQLVGLEVETTLHLPFDNPVFDYLEISMDEQSTSLLVFAAPRRLIENYTEILEDCGIKVRSVEISATALARLFTIGDRESFAETMLIHLDRGLLDLYLFHSGHPVFMRTMDLNDHLVNSGTEVAVVEEEANSLSAEQIVEIIAEISRMLSFYQYSLYEGQNRISDIVITGPVKGRKQLLSELAQALPELAIREVGFDSYPEGAAVTDAGLNEYRIALGAALREKGGFSIDLMFREDRETRIFPYVAIGLLFLWLLGAITVGFSYLQNKNDAAELARGIESAKSLGALLESELTALATEEGEGTSPQEAVVAIEYSRVNPVLIWDALDTALPEQAVIRDISYNQKADSALTIDFKSMEDASAYLVKLRGLSFAESVMIQSIAQINAAAVELPVEEGLPSKLYEAKFVIGMGGPGDKEEHKQPAKTEVENPDGNTE